MLNQGGINPELANQERGGPSFNETNKTCEKNVELKESFRSNKKKSNTTLSMQI